MPGSPHVEAWRFFTSRAAPAFIPGLAGCGRRVEPPEFLAGQRVVRRDEAVVAIPAAGAAGDHLAVDDERPGRIAARLDLRLPPHLAGSRVNADHIAVGRGVKNQILKDRRESWSAPPFPGRLYSQIVAPVAASRARTAPDGRVAYITPSWTSGIVSVDPAGMSQIEDHLELADILLC